MNFTLYLRPLSCLSSFSGIKAPILAPVKRYSWRASVMIAFSNPGMNRRWSACHIEDITRRKSFLVKLWSGSSTFSIVRSFSVNVLLIHCVAIRLIYIKKQKVNWPNLRWILPSGHPAQCWFAYSLQTHQIIFLRNWGPISWLVVHFLLSAPSPNGSTSEGILWSVYDLEPHRSCQVCSP